MSVHSGEDALHAEAESAPEPAGVPSPTGFSYIPPDECGDDPIVTVRERCALFREDGFMDVRVTDSPEGYPPGLYLEFWREKVIGYPWPPFDFPMTSAAQDQRRGLTHQSTGRGGSGSGIATSEP